MAYRFELDEPLADAVRRVLKAQARSIAAALAEKGALAARVHRSRKGLKRLRAVLILLRPALDEAVVGCEITFYRDLGRALAGARDAQGRVDALAALDRRFAVEPDAVAAIAAIEARLSAQRSSAERTLGPARRQALIAGLEDAHRRLDTLRLDAVTVDTLAAGAAISYRAARRAMKRAYRTGDDERFHGWRKHTQRHGRHLRLFNPVWPEMLAARAATARQIAALLGEDHDLTLLRQSLDETSSSQTLMVETLCGNRQTELRAQARPLGRRLYAEPPDHLVSSLASYWRAAGEAQAAAVAVPA